MAGAEGAVGRRVVTVSYGVVNVVVLYDGALGHAGEGAGERAGRLDQHDHAAGTGRARAGDSELRRRGLPRSGAGKVYRARGAGAVDADAVHRARLKREVAVYRDRAPSGGKRRAAVNGQTAHRPPGGGQRGVGGDLGVAAEGAARHKRERATAANHDAIRSGGPPEAPKLRVSLAGMLIVRLLPPGASSSAFTSPSPLKLLVNRWFPGIDERSSPGLSEAIAATV